MTVGLIYSRRTGRLRRVVKTDSDGPVDHHVQHEGEGLLVIPHAEYDTFTHHDHIQDRVTRHCGVAPSNDRYAVVHPAGHVDCVVIADPSCGDTGEHIGAGHVLVEHEHAGPGWRLHRGELSPE